MKKEKGKKKKMVFCHRALDTKMSRVSAAVASAAAVAALTV